MNLDWPCNVSSRLSCCHVFLKNDINGLQLFSYYSVREQGQDRDCDGVRQQGRAVWLHQRAPAPERAGDATLLQTDSLRRAPLPQGEKTHTVSMCILFFFLVTLNPPLSLSHTRTPKFCFPSRSMLFVTLTMHLQSQPSSQLICRPNTVCFSWRAGFRESSVSEWRWNTGQFNSSLRSDYRAPNRLGINSVLICRHADGCPEIPPEPLPRDPAPAAPTSTHVPHLANSLL